MATLPNSAESFPDWSTKAKEMAAEAKVLSGNKLEQLVVRIQRHTGRPKDTCWRFVIQYGIKNKPEYRRWTDPEFDLVREELVKGTVEQVAKKLNRTPKAIRNMLRRNHLSLRDIRCDLFSVESLATVLRVRKSEIVHWIEQEWLEASVGSRGKRHFYIITPEALIKLYKQHQQDLLKRGIRNQALFEAYLQYCFSPKHTIGEQLLDVRRDKRERAAFAAANAAGSDPDEDEEDDEDDQDEEDLGPSLVDLQELDESPED
jgi:Asp-tRNA(Asn)/Glu-tRNA(Gln) amidotransferase B subunit